MSDKMYSSMFEKIQDDRLFFQDRQLHNLKVFLLNCKVSSCKKYPEIIYTLVITRIET